jgi:hypothetical protein
MQVLSILQDASFESAAKAKKNYGNTWQPKKKRLPASIPTLFSNLLQVHRHEIVARMMGGRDLHRALPVSSTGFHAHQCGRALTASLAGREPAQPFDSVGGQELKLIDPGSHRSTQCTRIDSEENSGFHRRLPSNIRSEQ